ncbi:MAG TPA: cytochrome P450 [Acidimicrobiales bacterium]|jgi:cytochrome P450|nr:cytochrome P450 [Acidimicrobiales bacterium]
MSVLEEVAQPGEPPVGAAMAADHIDADLSWPATYEPAVPHEAFDRLRAAAPVAWHTERVPELLAQAGGAMRMLVDSPGFWAVTSHAEVTEVSRNPDRFSSWLGGVFMSSPDPNSLLMARQMMLNMDPPEHSRLRRILQPIFTPKAVQRLVESVERNAREIVDDIAADGECDLVPNVSAEMPLRVLADLLGMPRDDRHLMFDWSNKLIGIEDPEYGGNLGESMAALMEMMQYGKAIADDRRAEPRDDMVSMIVNAEVDGQRLTDVEFGMFWLLLVIAGNETTRNSFSGAVVALHEHDKWGELRDNPDLMPTAVDELLRYVSPVMQFRRTATHDTELGGQAIRAGDKVVIFYGAANRDPAVFTDPHGLDLARDPNPHVAFGIGPHFCLGSHLARLQLRSLLGELLQRLPDLEIDGSVERMRSNFISGIRHVPVRYTPAAPPPPPRPRRPTPVVL